MAREIIADLERRFGAERRRLLEDRQDRQKQLDAGKKPAFLAETKQVRDRNWKIAPLPEGGSTGRLCDLRPAPIRYVSL